jgi:hypothetical protein
MKPIISKNLTPQPPFPTREGGFQSLSPLRGEVWRGVCLYIKNFSNILLECVYLLRSPENAKRLFRALEWAETTIETPQTLAELKEELGI